VARNAARKRKLAKESLEPVFIGRDVRVDLAVGTFEIRVRDQAGAAVARSDDVDHVEIALDDRAIEMRVKKIESGRRPPMPEQARLDVTALEGHAQERVVE
jgi:hypothetical protein